jgi:superfamily II DNA or RNA helicase
VAQFRGTWRHYQEGCLAAFETDRAAGRDKTLLVAPPGSGKTLVGLEIVHRLGHPALVLCPTQTIQSQWRERQSLFGGPRDDIHLLTYQAICQADDPDGMLRDAAERHWIHERAEATGQTVAAVEAEAGAWTGAAVERRDRDVARLVARFKRDAAAGKLPDLPADELLSANARERLRALVDAGVRVVVLDECHHLVSLWGAMLRPLLAELRPAHVVGLTATNPAELTEEEAALYVELLGEVDFFIPTPAVVREGHLAPYQELVQLCEPLASERDWLAERHERLERLLIELDTPDALGLSAWLLARLRERRGPSGAQLSWNELARTRPRLAESGLRWLHARGEPPPAGAPRGERFRAPLGIEDWVVLLDDYAMRCLHAAPDEGGEATRRLDALQVALGDLGFTLTRAGIRRTGGDVDRVLLHSGAKPIAMLEALACEMEARGDGLRAAVLVDTERGPRQPEESPLALAGGARGLLAAAAADARVAPLRPALVTGETFAVAAFEAEWWKTVMGRAEDGARGAEPLSSEPLGHGIVALRGPGFDSRTWTARATELLGSGECGLLIGTRGLLGEGWDCPQLNVLIDMTAVAADISVRQMRGRSLRLDPSDSEKLASNWDIVCVAPDLERGHADYGRFIRRHAHLHAPCEDGTIETGPSHVHPELSPYGPPPADEFGAINAAQRDRAIDRLAARQRWAIGTPYRGVDLDALVVRRPARRMPVSDLTLSELTPLRRLPLGWLGARIGVGARSYPAELPLEWAAAAVCEAYVALGEAPAGAVESLAFTTRPEGWVRVSLPDASAQTSALVTAALDDVVGGGGLPRYVVSRVAAGEGTVWHAVPSDLARRKDRAEAFHHAWSRWCGRSKLVYAHGSEEGARLATEALAAPTHATQRRRIWR